MKKNSNVNKKAVKQKKSSCLPAVTHFPSPIKKGKPLSDEQKIELIENHFKSILEILGLDLSDDSLKHTPRRIAKMYVLEIFSGLNYDQFPQISTIKDLFQHHSKTNMVFVKVHFISFCEHHFVPMDGYAYVAYIPNGHLIGLSKIPRIVRYFARRPQVQERLTAQIADCLSIVLNTEDVAVSVTAEHYCVIARGIEDENGRTITNVLRGQFEKNSTLRGEFFEAIQRQ